MHNDDEFETRMWEHFWNIYRMPANPTKFQFLDHPMTQLKFIHLEMIKKSIEIYGKIRER